MIKEWREEIRRKTEHMNRKEKTEYVLTYYWYHMLLALLFLGLCGLVIYHIGWGKKEKAFSLVLVNQEVDFARDRSIRDEFAADSGISPEKIMVDSDYLISYSGEKLEGINESSFEKFFLNWSAGELDAVILPESFYHYCRSQGGAFTDLSKLLTKEEMEGLDCLFEDQGTYTGIFVSETKLAEKTACQEEDSVLLVFPKEMKHESSCRRFLEYLLLHGSSDESAHKPGRT